MKNNFRFVLVVLITTCVLIGANTNQIFAQEPTFTITGTPSTVESAQNDPQYKNKIGLFTESIIGEPGVRTADAGDTNCDPQKSCWKISPDIQHKLTHDIEGLDLREGGYLMVTLAKAQIKVGDVVIQVNAKKNHTWIVLLQGKEPGQEQGDDNNLAVSISNHDAGFGLATNLPDGSRVSEDYVLQNVMTAHTKGNCGQKGCKDVSILVYSAKTGGWVVISQSTASGKWVLVGTNIDAIKPSITATPTATEAK